MDPISLLIYLHRFGYRLVHHWSIAAPRSYSHDCSIGDSADIRSVAGAKARRTMKRLTFATILLGVLLVINFAPNTLRIQAQSNCKPWSVTDGTGITWRGTLCPDGPATPTATPTPVGSSTLTPTPISTSQPTLEPSEPSTGIWFSAAEAKSLPMAGDAWDAMFRAAESDCIPDPSNQDSACNVGIQAKAMVFARLDGIDAQQDLANLRRNDVVDAIGKLNAGCSSIGGRTLALGRELGAYVVAADLVDLSNIAPAVHLNFQACLRLLIAKPLDGMTLVQMFERRPNNWGTMGGATLAAVYVYLGDKAGLDRVAKVFCGWLGDRTCYASFTFGDTSWACAPAVGVNPVGCIKNGFNIGGALPDDMRRGGAFRMPNPSPTGYACGAMTGAVAMAWILQRAGYEPFEWSDDALLRAMRFLESIGWKCSGDDAGMVATINHVYGTSYAVEGATPGKNYGWQQWLFQRPAAQGDAAPVVQVIQATGETLLTLQDEIAKIQALHPGLVAVGGVYMVTTEDGELYAQDMMSGN